MHPSTRNVAKLLAGILLAAACVAGNAADHARGSVLVAGATGQTGRLIVAGLMAEGYTVRALVRDEATARELLGDRVKLFQGDVKEPASLTTAFAGADAVISAIGAKAAKGPDRPELIDFQGVKNLADAAAAAGARQFVLVSSRSVTHTDNPLNKMFGNVLIWKLKGENAVRTSGVPYTIVRPGGLINDAGAAKNIKFEQGDVDTGSTRIARADLARVCIASLGYPEARNRTFEISTADGPAANNWRTKFAALKADPK
ncbi:MAG: SDR family oxidoreductase [Gammaproteobacteria bacterium]